MIENHTKKKETKNKDGQFQNKDNNKIDLRMGRMKKNGWKIENEIKSEKVKIKNKNNGEIKFLN